jgi:hypothetical protein
MGSRGDAWRRQNCVVGSSSAAKDSPSRRRHHVLDKRRMLRFRPGTFAPFILCLAGRSWVRGSAFAASASWSFARRWRPGKNGWRRTKRPACTTGEGIERAAARHAVHAELRGADAELAPGKHRHARLRRSGLCIACQEGELTWGHADQGVRRSAPHVGFSMKPQSFGTGPVRPAGAQGQRRRFRTTTASTRSRRSGRLPTPCARRACGRRWASVCAVAWLDLAHIGARTRCGAAPDAQHVPHVSHTALRTSIALGATIRALAPPAYCTGAGERVSHAGASWPMLRVHE